MHAHARTTPRPARPAGLAIALAAAATLTGPAVGRAAPADSSADATIDPKAIPPAPPPGDRPIAEPTPAAQPSREPTAADVAGAPPPGSESGRTDPIDTGDSAARWIGRGILFLPRVAVEAAFTPVRAGIWVNERYRVYDRTIDLLFNDARTIGIYPTVGVQSGFGVTGGARFVDRDVFGAREHFSLGAATGGRYRARISSSFRTGERFGRLHLELKGEYDRRPKENFFGIGNADEVGAPAVEPIDALAGGAAIETRYRQQVMRARAVVDARVASGLHLRGAGAATDFDVARSDVGPPIDEVYRPTTLIGWTGARELYGELELRWDDRRPVSTWEPRPLYATGTFAGLYAGRAHRLDDGVDSWRYGADLQHFVRVGRGPRVIMARAHIEAVSGTRTTVPFFDLPTLGGATLLRGYDTERFRDRIAAVASLDYQWDLSQLFSANLFTDVGRVYELAGDLGLSGLRVGYGVGLEAHTRHSFWLRGSISSSIDGGVFLNLSFEPVFEVDGRVEKL